ncbi:MAG: hypothetical protein ACYTDU_14655 [Planctomycetota bacterium]
MVRTRAALLGLALAAACGTTPAPSPESGDRAAVAIAVRTSYPSDAQWGRPRVVYFVRLEAKGDPSFAAEVFKSNHYTGGIAYLVNVPPGYWAAVASTEERDGRERTTYFPAEMIKDSLTKADAGAVVLLGSFEVQQVRVGTTADPAQEHYRPLVEPDRSKANLFTKIFAQSRYFNGRAYTSLSDRAQREERARSHLAESGW